MRSAEHTDNSLKGLETIVRQARLDHVNVRYAELAANMADVARRAQQEDRQVQISRSECFADWTGAREPGLDQHIQLRFARRQCPDLEIRLLLGDPRDVLPADYCAVWQPQSTGTSQWC